MWECNPVICRADGKIGHLKLSSKPANLKHLVQPVSWNVSNTCPLVANCSIAHKLLPLSVILRQSSLWCLLRLKFVINSLLDAIITWWNVTIESRALLANWVFRCMGGYSVPESTTRSAQTLASNDVTRTRWYQSTCWPHFWETSFIFVAAKVAGPSILNRSSDGRLLSEKCVGV